MTTNTTVNASQEKTSGFMNLHVMGRITSGLSYINDIKVKNGNVLCRISAMRGEWDAVKQVRPDNTHYYVVSKNESVKAQLLQIKAHLDANPDMNNAVLAHFRIADVHQHLFQYNDDVKDAKGNVLFEEGENGCVLRGDLISLNHVKIDGVSFDFKDLPTDTLAADLAKYASCDLTLRRVRKVTPRKGPEFIAVDVIARYDDKSIRYDAKITGAVAQSLMGYAMERIASNNALSESLTCQATLSDVYLDSFVYEKDKMSTDGKKVLHKAGEKGFTVKTRLLKFELDQIKLGNEIISMTADGIIAAPVDNN